MKTFDIIKKYKFYIIIGQFFKIAEATLELFIPIFVANIINIGITNKNYNFIIIIGIHIILFICLGLIFAIICQFMAAKSSQLVARKIRKNIFEKISGLTYIDIDKLDGHKVNIAISNDVNKVQYMIAMIVRLFARAPFLLVGALIMCFLINIKMFMILLISIIFEILISVIFFKKLSISIKETQLFLENLLNILKDTLFGNLVIRGYNYQSRIKKDFNNENNKLMRLGYKVGKINTWLNVTITGILYINLVVILFIGFNLAKNGLISKGDLIAFISYLTLVIYAFNILTKLVSICSIGLESIKRIDDILLFNPNKLEKKENDLFEDENIETDNIIEVKNISFSYSNDSNDVIKDISFSIKKNEKIGIIGRIGSGKSTLINLLVKNYNPKKGNIYINNKNIKFLSNNDIYSLFSYSRQKAKLVSATIRDNLCWSKFDATDNEMKNALKLSSSNDILDKGLDFCLVNQGANLSGGQRQRLTLARTFLKKASIYIFDDTLSAIDAISKANIIKNIHNLDATVIIISQRIEEIVDCDRIMVIEDGIIEGFDTHNNLLKKSDTYFSILESQVKDEI